MRISSSSINLLEWASPTLIMAYRWYVIPLLVRNLSKINAQGTSEDAAADVAAFVSIFFEHFTQFKGRPFHMAGESYAVRTLIYVLLSSNPDLLLGTISSPIRVCRLRPKQQVD